MSKYGGLQNHTDTVCIQCDQILYFYLKKLVAQKVGQPRSLEKFQSGGTDTEAPNETSSASRPSFSTDTTSLLFAYSSAMTIFCFFDKIKLK